MPPSENLAEILRRTLDNVPYKETVVSIHLFGIDNAPELGSLSIRELADLAEQAGTHRSYATEIRKGIKLAAYVRRR